MSRPSIGRLLVFVATVMLMLATIPSSAWGQATRGRVDVTVLDPKGSVVPGAKLELKDLATNDVRTADTQAEGTFSFVNLPLGKYTLTVTKQGFQTSVYDVIVEGTKTTAVEATLKVGAVTEVVQVGAAAPVVDTTSNVLGSVLNLKQLEDLPLSGRNLNQLLILTPGFTGFPGGDTGTGTFNGLPVYALGSNIDGVQQAATRMKFSSDVTTNFAQSVQARLEDIEEMTIQTDALDLNQGFGQASVQINFTTRRGSNAFHGRMFEDFQNSWLNANSWRNNASGLLRPEFEHNEFGGSIGGPILKDKLFFFGSFSTIQQPGASAVSASFLPAPAQAGNYIYTSSAASGAYGPGGSTVCNGTACTVNLFAVASANSLPTSVNTVIASQLSAINKSVQFGSVTATSDPIINTLNWITPTPQHWWYPTMRVDYNLNSKIRMNLSWNRSITVQPIANTPYFPGSDFANTGVGNRFNAYTASYGLDWNISPTLLNQFRGGFLYNASFFGYNSPKLYIQNPVNVNWPLGLTTPQNYVLPVTSYYPVFDVSDTLTWQKKSHSFNFGYSFYREQDHYWNPPEITHIGLGLATGDPALTAFTPGSSATSVVMPGSNVSQQGEAQSLYALLSGRITSASQSYPVQKNGQYATVPAQEFPLDELSKAWSLYFQDSWRFRPTLTINYGMRWDFTGDNHDLQLAYHNSGFSSLLGPSSALFQPGTLTGNQSPTISTTAHAYNSWNRSPQPMLGIAWAPHVEKGFLHKLLGTDDTVIRVSGAIRKFTVPYQYFWDYATDFGAVYYQFSNLAPTCTTPANCPTGQFVPGTLTVGSVPPYSAFSKFPTNYQTSYTQASFEFLPSAPGVNGMNPNIAQPYTQSWSLGIQRKLGNSRAFEIRYNGNRTVKQWLGENLNEVNIFENGFLQEFKNAQSNLSICQANAAACRAAQAGAGASTTSSNDFGDWGLAGQVPLPIMTAAFTGSTNVSLPALAGNPNSCTPSSGFPNPQCFSGFRGAGSSVLTYLAQGRAGSFANLLTTVGGTPYFCNLVGASFTPCVANANYAGGFAGHGANYPINFFQANPYTTGNGVGYMDAVGYSTYNALQVDFRQRQWHGMEFDANYTWSHTLGLTSPNDWTGAYPSFTLRNLNVGYGPTLYDLRHVFHLTGTYDLPFGRGRKWAAGNALADRVVGGWTIGTILTYQSGFASRLLGSNSGTYNTTAGDGVILNGLTPSQLQSAVGVYRVPGSNFTTILPTNYLVRQTGGGANAAVFSDNIIPGTFASPIYIYGPGGFYDNMSISKAIAITERWRFSLQCELLNAFNHPVFGQTTTPLQTSILSSSFAVQGANTASGNGNYGRVLELRANISF